MHALPPVSEALWRHMGRRLGQRMLGRVQAVWVALPLIASNSQVGARKPREC